jgi:hypothetical protein
MKTFFVIGGLFFIVCVLQIVCADVVNMQVYIEVPSTTTTFHTTNLGGPHVVGAAIAVDKVSTTTLSAANPTSSSSSTIPQAKITYIEETTATMAYGQVPMFVASEAVNETAPSTLPTANVDDLSAEAEPSGVLGWFSTLFNGWF